MSLACILMASPALAADWRNVGMDLEVDLQSVKPAGTASTVEVRHTNVQSEGLPPPAVLVEQHYRFDCVGHTAQGLDVTYFNAAGERIGGGPYPAAEQARLLPVGPTTMMGKIEGLVCPKLLHR